MILVLVPALAVATASIAAFFGAWWWPLDLLANFRPHYSIFLLLAGLLLLVFRWRRTGGLVLALGLLNLALLVPLYVAPDRATAVTGERLRVLSFNVRADNESYAAVADYIRRIEPDVVFLHEATRLWREALEEADLGYQVVEGRGPDLIFSTLVLAPPGARVESFGFSETEPRAIEVELLTASGEQIDLLGVHPVSPDTERRALLRDAQLSYAAEWAARQEGRVVVAGDLNATPWSHIFNRLQREGSLLNSQRGFGLQPTFPADANPLIRIPIDHLLYRGGLAILDRRLGPALGSDHFPLVVDLALTA